MPREGSAVGQTSYGVGEEEPLQGKKKGRKIGFEWPS